MRFPEKPPLISNGFKYEVAFQELVKTGRAGEFFEICDQKYYYYDKWKYRAQDWGIDPEKLWASVKLNRRVTNKTLNISALTGFTFTVSSPSFVQKHLHEFDLNLGGSLQGDTVIPSEDRDRYLISSLMEEA